MTAFERFSRRDLRLVATCILVSAVSLFVGIRYFFLAFPEASIDFRVTAEESAAPAESFLRSLALDPVGYRHASVFGFDDEAKTFLEREVSLAERAALLDGKVRLWRWKHRWFRPLEKEEYSVEVTTRGEVAGFRHELPEDAPGGDPPEGEARAAAEEFLARVLGRAAATLEFVEGSSQKRERRTDHTFVWKEPGFLAAGGDYRYEVALAGGRPAGYREHLKLPDAWVRDYESLRSKNDLAALVAAVGLLATMAFLLASLVLRIRRGDVRWRTASLFGAITAVLLTASQLNALPASLYEYDTLRSFPGFLAIAVMQALAAGALGGIYIFLLTAAGEPFYRERFPKHLSLTSLLRPRAFATKEFFLANLAGLTLTCLFFAYENVFYMIAHALGAWSPREVPYTDLLSTAFPWAFVLFFGWFPAVSEEFLSRMFSIPFLERIAKSTVLAVVVSAFLWGFAHANYPNQPFYIRGLEVGIAGVLFGLVFLRFGIVAVLVCHFSVDALYAALALIRSPSLYQQATGALAAGLFVLAFVASLAGYWKRGGFAAPDRTNEDEGVAAPPSAPESAPVPAAPQVAYRPLPPKLVVAALAAATVLAAVRLVPVERFGEWVELRTNRAEAREIARRFLEGQGFDLSGTRSAVTSASSLVTDQAQYVQAEGGLEAAETFYRDLVPTPSWMVRFFVPGRHEELRVRVNTSSERVLGFARVLPDDAEGARVSPAEAAAIAETFLTRQGADASAGERKEQTAKDEKARRDHMLAYELPQPSAGEARLRQEIDVQGDRVGRWKRSVKVPESWERERAEVTIGSVVLRWLKAPLLVVFASFAILLLVGRIRRGEMEWKAGLAAAAVVTSAWVVHSFLVFDRFWEAYPTSIPAAIFLTSGIAGIGVLAAVFFGGSLLAGALVAGLYPAARGMLAAPFRRAAGRDAAAAGFVALGALVGCAAVSQAIGAAIPAGRLLGGLSPPTCFEASLPFLDALCLAVVAAFVVGVCGAVVAAVLSDHLGSAALRAVLAVATVVAFIPSGAVTAAERAVGAVTVATWLAVVVLIAAALLRDNPLAWVFGPFAALATWNGVRLATSPDEFFRWNGIVVLALTAALAAWLLAPSRPGADRAPRRPDR